MSRIPESALVLPTLEFLYEAEAGEMRTAELIDRLAELFEPTGEDAEILEGRRDTKFSQKVRNLKSHQTLEKVGWAERIDEGFRITEKGRRLIEAMRH